MESSEPTEYKIAEDAVAKICMNRARFMNSEAQQAGQSQRITATDLEDLYYKQGGRCAICGVPVEDHGGQKHPRAIQADHIQNVNRRSTFAARAAGGNVDGALIADISNVQWVCRLCNTLKQIVVSSGVDWSEHISGCHKQSAAGFPLRNNVAVCGSRASRRGRRMAWMQEQFAMRGHALSSGDVSAHFRGTELEAHLATYLKELKSIGWCGMRHMAEVRRAVVQEMAERAFSSGEELATFKEWCGQFNKVITERYGWPSVSTTRFQQLCEESGALFFTTRVQAKTLERVASSSEKAMIRAFLKEKGRLGASIQDVCDSLVSDTFTLSLFEKAMNELAAIGQIERHDGRAFYCMSRKEAAEVLGVKVHKFKKWAAYGNGPVFLKSPSNTKGDCYYSSRTLFDFAESRRVKTLELACAGQ